jgi:hypothetical protein
MDAWDVRQQPGGEVMMERYGTTTTPHRPSVKQTLFSQV